MQQQFIYADDATEDVGLLVRLRLPWLIVGLFIGMVISFVISRFESVLSEQLSLVFFLPIIVYMSDAVGTQTETIYIRNLIRTPKSTKLSTYFVKELLFGLITGGVAGGLLAGIAYWWLGSTDLALLVGLAMLASMTAATMYALFVPVFIHRLIKVDPAIGAGPFTTAIQDLISVSLYLLIASVIIL